MSTIMLRSAITVFLGVALVACGAAQARNDEWHPGIPKRSGRLSGQQQQGTWTYWHPSGAKQAEGGFQDDKQDGAWAWWYPDGTVQQQGQYAGPGLRVGPWRFAHPDGKPKAEGAYGVAPVDGKGAWTALDRQHGLWRYWHANGTPAANGWFDAGAKTLLWTAWDEQGQRLEQGAYWQGTKVGPWHERVAGADRLVDHGCPAGYQCYREPTTGQPTRWGMLKDQRPAGLWLAFTADGTPRAASLDTVDQERWMAWLPDGRLMAAGDRQGQGEIEHWFHAADDAAALVVEHEREVTVARQALRAPLVATIAKAPVAEPTIQASPLTRMVLSPLPVLPGFWTPKEEASAASLIKAYSTTTETTDGYTWSTSRKDPKDRRADLLGKPLPQTRLLSATGEVVDLADSAAAQRNCLVVVLRGFSGQVCIYCATQTAAIVDNLARFESANTDVVLLYPGPAESVPQFIAAVRSLGKEVPPRLLLAIDPDLLLVRQMKIEDQLAKPTSLLLDRSGTVRWIYMGAAHDDRPAVDEVLAQVARLP